MSENKNIINEQEPQDDHMIEGRNAVLEVFRAGKTIDKLYIQDGLRDPPRHFSVILFVHPFLPPSICRISSL